MVVVMQEGAKEEQIQNVIDRLIQMGFDVHRSTGAAHTVLGAVGGVPVDHRDIEQLANTERVSTDFLIQGHTFDIFHRDKMRPAALADLIDVRDVRMRERRRRACLLKKTMQPLLIARDFRR